MDFEFLDLSSQRSVREFVRRFKERKRPLHVLVNNGEFNDDLFLSPFHFRSSAVLCVFGNDVAGDTGS